MQNSSMIGIMESDYITAHITIMHVVIISGGCLSWLFSYLINAKAFS